MEFTPHPTLRDIIEIVPDIHGDSRGWFTETYQKKKYTDGRVLPEFVQDNLAHSQRGVLRGLHAQLGVKKQDKLVYVVEGEIYDVAVDIRPYSQTQGQWCGMTLDSTRRNQVFIPAGFAHGYYVLSESATIAYKVSNVWDPGAEVAVQWNDPAIGIEWPLIDGAQPELSERDRNAPPLVEQMEVIRHLLRG